MILKSFLFPFILPSVLARQSKFEVEEQSGFLRRSGTWSSSTLETARIPPRSVETRSLQASPDIGVVQIPVFTPSRGTSASPSTFPSTQRPTARYVTPTRAPTPTAQFVTAATANEYVIIPDPPIPSYDLRSRCPHLDDGLLDWHSTSTWGGPIPTDGVNVTLPKNSRIVVRQSVIEKLSFVYIPVSSELIFGENSTGITFDAYGIIVHGNLTIGSETCRLVEPVTITLHGLRPTDAVTNVPPPEIKGISVSGQINIHGQRFYRTWTRLAYTANPGDSVLMLQNAVNWEPGQEVVLVTTAMKDSREWHRNEVAIVKNVVLNPRAGVEAEVYLEQPILYQHVANGGYQGEVGLLSRQVKIQGNHASEPTDPDPLNCTLTDSKYGDRAAPCLETELTGYGGHIIVHQGGKGYVEGVELYRMGQTNVMGRYPMHFHLLDDGCSDCYFRDSSVHRSFYRCISIHGTHYTQVSENVAYDVNGYCYYLEDGIEHHNRIEYNLGAHIHMIGPALATSKNQSIPLYRRSSTLNLPADATASAFYITNVNNYIVGNAASGGWAGFAFPILPSPVGLSRKVNLRPSSVTELRIDGNTAHSTGWWWKHSAAFYFGGSLYYNDDDVLEYQAGRDVVKRRNTCLVDKCLSVDGCGSICMPWEQAWMTVSNTKAFLTAGIGLGSWFARLDVVGFECHDCGLSMQAQATEGFSAHDVLVNCRSQTPIVLPSAASANKIRADGFMWYDTGQEHILYNVTFRHCGYRSADYDQYDEGSTRGCGDEPDIGCSPDASVWSMVTHSDQHVPEVMQATRGVTFENCGRRFRNFDFRQSLAPHPTSNSGRLQNWYDIDGSITGLNERSVAASGLADAGMWWQVDNEMVYDPQGPLWFFKLDSGPQRGIGSLNLRWDRSVDAEVGTTQCGNGPFIPCDFVGRIKHLGEKYNDDLGLPVTAKADLVGPVGGFGWKLELDRGAPKSVFIAEVEVDPATPLLLSIAYPAGTSFNITAFASNCNASATHTCEEVFHQVDTVTAVRNSLGNTYHVDSNGVLTFRVIQTPSLFVGRPEFFLPQFTDKGMDGIGEALERFERDGIRLPVFTYGNKIKLYADCPSSGAYCSELPAPFEPDVCPDGYVQTGYDVCRKIANGTVSKIFADGSTFSVGL